MKTKTTYRNATVKVYDGYGYTNNMVVYGHVFANKPVIRHNYTNNVLLNIVHLFRLFLVKPLPRVKLRLQCGNQQLHGATEDDGFFNFEWTSTNEMSAGWHAVTVDYLDESGLPAATGEGKVFVPHPTQYAFISDIDDTVLVSHSATIGKRLRALFTKNPRTRKVFTDAVRHYGLLAVANTTPGMPNPFFYVSSSEWNLYDYLREFFHFNGLPQGIFLLNQIKRWYQLLKTGKTKHEGKLIRVVRIIDAFPKQQFVLLGDNSQSDPSIYTAISNKYPEKIFAIYIRNIHAVNETATKELFKTLQNKSTHTCLFNNNSEAIEHAKTIGLIV